MRDEEDEPSPSEYVDNISFERYWYQYCVRAQDFLYLYCLFLLFFLMPNRPLATFGLDSNIIHFSTFLSYLFPFKPDKSFYFMQCSTKLTYIFLIMYKI